MSDTDWSLGIWWWGDGLGRGIVGGRRGGKAGGRMKEACLRSMQDMAYRFRLLHTIWAGRILHLQALKSWGTGLLWRHSAP